jgi:hypothetical protein
MDTCESFEASEVRYIHVLQSSSPPSSSFSLE